MATRDKEWHYIMLKGSIKKVIIVIQSSKLQMYEAIFFRIEVRNKQKHNNIIQYPLSIRDRKTRLMINKEIED